MVVKRAHDWYSDFSFSRHMHAMLSCFSHVQLFLTLWTVAHQAPLSMEFSKQEYWNGLSFPSPGDLPDQGLNPGLLCYRQILYHLSHQGIPIYIHLVQFSSVQSLSCVRLFVTP